MWYVDYYEKENGDVPVIEFLKGLTDKMQAKALRAIDLLEEKGTTLKEPYVKSVEGPIWELRIKFASDITRIFYFAPCGNKFILLHGFVKKTDKIPPRVKALAKSYYEDYQRRFPAK
ncbi:type II toxin-antitoxin system RelE/ParE family toxin [Ruminococcaceae bacterium OttesenSCG-928-D13]|nr:type II toxin-antitoxin system RelE/ParE family toxin [Ruminococcaceae bacterium OttesenSCG-928-D13]